MASAKQDVACIPGTSRSCGQLVTVRRDRRPGPGRAAPLAPWLQLAVVAPLGGGSLLFGVLPCQMKPAQIKLAAAMMLGSAVVSAAASGAAAPPSLPPPVPPGHPRVYLRPTDLPALRAKSKDRSAHHLWQSVTNRASDPVVLAFTGLLEQDPSKCAKAVDAMGEIIKKTVSAKDPAKEETVAGRTFLSVQHQGAVVLDWCYDTMDNATKMSFVDGLKKVANIDAPGFPIVSALGPSHYCSRSEVAHALTPIGI